MYEDMEVAYLMGAYAAEALRPLVEYKAEIATKTWDDATARMLAATIHADQRRKLTRNHGMYTSGIEKVRAEAIATIDVLSSLGKQYASNGKVIIDDGADDLPVSLLLSDIVTAIRNLTADRDHAIVFAEAYERG